MDDRRWAALATQPAMADREVWGAVLRSGPHPVPPGAAEEYEAPRNVVGLGWRTYRQSRCETARVRRGSWDTRTALNARARTVPGIAADGAGLGAGQESKIDIIDPPSFVYVTEHFVYATTPPPAGVVPVVADTSAVFPYHGEAPGQFAVDVEAYVVGKRGFRGDTWNIGLGVTGWVPFDCRADTRTTVEPTTSTSASIAGATTTTAASKTTPIGNLGTTTASIDDPTTTSIENLGTTTTDASVSTGSLPFTGGGSGLVPVALITLGAGLAFVFGAKRRRLSRN